jgi:hypothetical protein
VLLPVLAHVLVHVLGRSAQRQLAQREQVAPQEEVLGGAPGLVRQVHLALFEAPQELLRRDVHQLDGVRAVEHGVGHGLAHLHVRDLRHHVVEALHVLHVQGGEHVDAGVQQLLHVVPALRVAGARGVGVGQLVHQHHGGGPREDAVEVELLEQPAPIGHAAPGQQREPLDERGRVRPTVVLHDPDDHIELLDLTQLVRHLQHAVRLAHARREAEVDLQLPALCASLVLLQAAEQRVGVGSVVGLLHRSTARCPFGSGRQAPR